MQDQHLIERGGGARGNRTPDLLNAIQALSQLSYGPTGARTLPAGSGAVKAFRAPSPSAGRGLRAPCISLARGILPAAAGVAKLVYAGDSKSPDRKVVRVRVPPPAPGARHSRRLVSRVR